MRVPCALIHTPLSVASLADSREGIESHFNPEVKLLMDSLSTSVAEHALSGEAAAHPGFLPSSWRVIRLSRQPGP